MRIREAAQLVWKALQASMDKNGVEISGHIAFTTMLALFPFLLFVISLAGFLGDTRMGQDFVATLSLFAPPEVMKTLAPAIQQIVEHRSSGLLTLGLLLSLYSAGSGVAAIRLALNLAYGLQETRPFWYRKLQDFAIVIVGSIVGILASAVIILGPQIWRMITLLLPVSAADQSWWHLIRYAFTLVAMLGIIVALHRVLPNARITVRDILPGAVLTTIIWIVTASLLTIYFGRFTNYEATYGSLGGVIVTLLFFYVSGIIFIFGGELNAALLARRGNAVPAEIQESRSFARS